MRNNKNIFFKLKNFFINPIVLLLLSGFLLRLILSGFGTLTLDQNTFIAWAHSVNTQGPAHFYNGWSDYLPGFIYVLWFLAKLETVLNISPIILYKLPAMIADIIAAFFVYNLVTKVRDKKRGLIAACLVLFNPAFLSNSTLWGQVDILTALFACLSIYFFKRNWFFSAFLLAFGALVKPQAALAAPVILFMMYEKKTKFIELLRYVILSGAIFILGFYPFLNKRDILVFISERLNITLSQYPYTSINAFNFWGIWGFWKHEGLGFFSEKNTGLILFTIISAFGYLKLKKGKLSQYTLLSILLLGNFLFFTRMHERHLLPALLPLAVVSAINPILLIPFIVLSLSYVLNMQYAYYWIVDNFKEIYSPSVSSVISIINVLAIFYILFSEKIKVIAEKTLSFLGRKKAYKEVALYLINYWSQKNEPKLNGTTRFYKPKLLLLLIVLFAFTTRFISLENPPHEYFDEVYHAFTAKAMLNGNVMAWEWWNENPAGFAYEWTHPPLAKEAMVLGMLVFGENSFGYRAPAALFGTGAVILIYLIAKKLFNEEVGLLSAFVFSLDGLALVTSRIGMNDIYLVFFLLFCFLLLLHERYFWSAVCLGLALSSKWTTFWFLPIVLFSIIVLKKKIRYKVFWYFLLPPIIYLICYIPMFTSGHTWEIFWGMQKQMWWYHTRLVATHPYTSSWFTWPFLVRPLWLYTSGIVDGLIGNIYAFGNPLVFWGGFVSVLGSIYYALREKRKHLLIITAAYIGVFVPWALSPRIMFLYHYFPAIPFLSIATGFVLYRNKKFIVPFLVLTLILFIYFYPHWTGIPVPEWLNESYYWFPSWR